MTKNLPSIGKGRVVFVFLVFYFQLPRSFFFLLIWLLILFHSTQQTNRLDTFVNYKMALTVSCPAQNLQDPANKDQNPRALSWGTEGCPKHLQNIVPAVHMWKIWPWEKKNWEIFNLNSPNFHHLVVGQMHLEVSRKSDKFKYSIQILPMLPKTTQP